MTHKKTSGFTLLEVLIVTLFLSVLAYTTFQEIRSTVGAKEEVDQKTEVLQESRAVIALFDRDVRAATMITAADTVWEPVTRKDGEAPAVEPQPITLFKGEAQYLFFSARSHQRMSADIPENEQHFVTYQIVNGDLIRAESPRAVNKADKEDPEKFRRFTVLRNVKKLVFTFWDDKSFKWIDRWDSERTDTKNQLPAAVKLEVDYQPDAKDTIRRKVKPSQIITSVRIFEQAFKSAPVKKPAAGANPSTPGSSGSGGVSGGSSG